MNLRLLTRFLGFVLPISIILIPLVSPADGQEAAQAKAPSPWAKAKEAFDQFRRDPSRKMAGEFYFAISDDNKIKGDKTEILDYILGRNQDVLTLSTGHYGIIATEMLNGNDYAARSAIKLLGFIAKGWQKPESIRFLVGLRVGASLGDLIRANPSLFLKACYDERDDPFLKEKEYPVNYIPFILHMKKTMVSYEMEMRIAALKSVEDPELRLIRDACLDTIEKGTQLFESQALNRPDDSEESEEESLSEPKKTVKNALSEMKSRPSSENMKKVLALFDERREEFRYVPSSIFPLTYLPEDVAWPPKRKSGADPLGIIVHEAICGNEYAIEVSFSALRYAARGDDLAALELYELISNLILIRPAVFIEKAAKFRYLETERPDTLPKDSGPVNFLDVLCSNFFDNHGDYSHPAAEKVILSGRMTALAALNMPEHKDLIQRCIGYIKKTLA